MLFIPRFYHCLKGVQLWRFFWSVFSSIQFEYRKMRTRKNSILGHFSRSVLAFYEHIHLGPNQSLRHLLCFSSRCKDLIRAHPWSKNNLINDWENIIAYWENVIGYWENIIAYWEKSERSEALLNKFGLFQKQLGNLGGGNSRTSRKQCNFYPL